MDEDSPFDDYRVAVDWPLVRLFREYGRPHLPWFAAGVVSNVLSRAASLVPPIVLGVTIDAVFRDEVPYALPLVPGAWVPSGRIAQFQFSLGLIVAALVATAVFTWAQGVAGDVFAHRVLHAVRVDTYERMQRLDVRFFDDAETGELMSILNNDASNLEIFLDNAMKNAVRLVVLIVLIAGALVWLNRQLAFVALVAVPAMVGFTWWFMRAIEPRYTAVRESIGALNTRLENSLAGIELVKTAATETYETSRVRDASRAFYEDNVAVFKLYFLYRPGMEAMAGASFLATFLVGGFWLLGRPLPGFSGELELGTFVTFLFLTQRFVDPLAQISNVVDWYENANASGKRVFGLMDVPVGVTDAPDAVDLSDVEGRIEYDGVTFAYDEGPVLDGVDFTAEPGETVGLAGSTGAGKSTVAKLLLRLYDVDEGAIRVDGHDVQEVTTESLRREIGYVSQETFLFDETIAENVRYGRFDASREAVIAAAKAAEAHGFIEELPEGYDTQVGERGVKLSGGQRQRIAIARTVLQDPEILLLDEATSAVDTETEYLIQRSLDRLTADRTTLVIAHRLSTIKDADTILVLDDGEVVERGTHSDLVDRDGVYATLWGIQAGDPDGASGTSADRIPESIADAAERNEHT